MRAWCVFISSGLLEPCLCDLSVGSQKLRVQYLFRNHSCSSCVFTWLNVRNKSFISTIGSSACWCRWVSLSFVWADAVMIHSCEQKALRLCSVPPSWPTSDPEGNSELLRVTLVQEQTVTGRKRCVKPSLEETLTETQMILSFRTLATQWLSQESSVQNQTNERGLITSPSIASGSSHTQVSSPLSFQF